MPLPVPWEKCLYQDKHVTLASEAATAPSPAMDANLHTIKNAIVFISEHILVQFGCQNKFNMPYANIWLSERNAVVYIPN